MSELQQDWRADNKFLKKSAMNLELDNNYTSLFAFDDMLLQFIKRTILMILLLWLIQEN